MNVLGSIPLYIQPTFWLLASFIGWVSSRTLLEFGLWVIVVFVSVLVHELGHALTARYWKQRVHIELGLFGGLTVRHGPSMGKFKEFVIILMGPLFGFMLAGFGMFVLMFSLQKFAVAYFFEVLVYANIFWSILNLAPVQPLDGGKLMSIGFEALFGLEGVRYSYLISALFSISLMVLFFSQGSFLGVLLFLLFAYESLRSFVQARPTRTSGEDERQLEYLNRAERLWHEGDQTTAIELVEKIVRQEAKGDVYYQALELLVSFFLAIDQNDKAYRLLSEHKAHLSDAQLRQMQVASYKLGKFSEALEYGKRAFLEDQNMTSAIINAYTCAKIGEVEQAIYWLKAIKRIDLRVFKKVIESEELLPIRQNPDFRLLNS